MIGVVILEAATGPGITITLSSDDPTVAILTITIMTISQGYTQAAFTIYIMLVSALN